MTSRTIALATIAALALGYGLMRLPGPQGPGQGPGSPIVVSRQVEALTEESRMPAATARQKISEVALGERLSATTTVSNGWPDLPAEPDSWSDAPSIDIGEPMDPDDDLVWDAALADQDPIAIGPELDADDQLARESDEPSQSPIVLGELLDADDADAWDSTLAEEEHIEIGFHLDADDSSGWTIDDFPSTPIEIGAVLDAGAPMEHGAL